MAAIKVKLVHGLSGISADHRATIVGLGLKKTNSEKILPDTPQTLGMISKVSYLIEWERVDGCPLCSSSYHLIIDAEASVVVCRDCGHRYVDPRPTQAESGKPPVRALPRQIKSGTTPVCSTANHFPVRPKPV